MELDSDQGGPPPEPWQQRFNALAAWRAMTAENEECDPSALLTFPAMRQIAERVPASIEALASLDGVGQLVIEKYADEVAAILGISQAGEAAPPPAPPAAPAATAPIPSEELPSWQVSLELFQDGFTPLAIAERRMLSPGTVASHLITSIRKGFTVDFTPILPEAEQVEAVKREIMRDPDASISDVHERLGYRLSRPEVSLVMAYLRPPEVEE